MHDTGVWFKGKGWHKTNISSCSPLPPHTSLPHPRRAERPCRPDAARLPLPHALLHALLAARAALSAPSSTPSGALGLVRIVHSFFSPPTRVTAAAATPPDVCSCATGPCVGRISAAYVGLLGFWMCRATSSQSARPFSSSRPAERFLPLQTAAKPPCSTSEGTLSRATSLLVANTTSRLQGRNAFGSCHTYAAASVPPRGCRLD